MSASRHGQSLRGLDNVSESSVSEGRFGRMFRNLGPAYLAEAPDKVEAMLLALGATMIQGEFADRIAKGEPVDVSLGEKEPEDENPTVAAGYTYLGQFIDHDITFDPTSTLDRFNDPDALHDFRTPRLDLDSLYGAGPANQPFLYDSDGFHLLVGEDKDFNAGRKQRPDLPRNTASPKRALTGDKRNDENLIVSQLHSLFIRFHNKVLDKLVGKNKPTERDFLRAQTVVRWHYQWIVLHEYLPRIVGAANYKSVVGGPGKKPTLEFFKSKSGEAYMPVEFAGAAFRFGHSMVRPSYALNNLVRKADPDVQPFNNFPKAKFKRIPVFSLLDVTKTPLANLNGFRELPGFWAIDWHFFFDGLTPDGKLDPADGKPPVVPQPSYKMDTILADPLLALPDHVDQPEPRRSLANLNLLRGWRLGLPSGQAVARRMSLEPLSDDVLFDLGVKKPDERAKSRAKLYKDNAALLEDNAPLWYYILKEAETEGKTEHLGSVGGRIVAEVLTGMVTYDRRSFLSVAPKWTPELPAAKKGTFTMADLVKFTNG